MTNNLITNPRENEWMSYRFRPRPVQSIKGGVVLMPTYNCLSYFRTSHKNALLERLQYAMINLHGIFNDTTETKKKEL